MGDPTPRERAERIKQRNAAFKPLDCDRIVAEITEHARIERRWGLQRGFYDGYELSRARGNCLSAEMVAADSVTYARRTEQMLNDTAPGNHLTVAEEIARRHCDSPFHDTRPGLCSYCESLAGSIQVALDYEGRVSAELEAGM